MSLRFEDYRVTEEGDIISPYRKLKPWLSQKGYAKVTICKKHYAVHRLVATRFIPNPENKPHVNHIDGNKLNNRVDNLEWVTEQENKTHAYRNGLYKTKLSNTDAVNIVSLCKTKSQSEVARLYDVVPSSIRKILRGQRKTLEVA